MDTTCKGLLEHWAWAAEKGIMNKNSAGSLRAACVQVLSAVDGAESIDIDDLDVADAVNRFKNLKARDFKPKTVAEYARRFDRAVQSYKGYLNDPAKWRHSFNVKSAPKRTKNDPAQREIIEPATSAEIDVQTSSGMVKYPFPLRPDRIAQLELPNDLTLPEVKRLHRFLEALAVDFGAEE